MSILDRMNRLVRANINDLMSRADALRNTVSDMRSSIGEARSQLAKAERDEDKLIRSWETLREEAMVWEDRAAHSLREGDEERARECLRRKHDLDEKVQARRVELERHREYIDNLVRSLDALEMKVDSIKTRQRSMDSHLDDERSHRSTAAPPRSAPTEEPRRFDFPSFPSKTEHSRNTHRSSSTSSNPRRAFVFDDDMRREYPEDVFGAGEPFEEFDRVEGSVRRSEARAQASSELDGYEDPLHDHLEDRFRRLDRQHQEREDLAQLNRLKDRARSETPPSRHAPTRSSRSSSSPSNIDDIKRQLAADLDD